jgi:hypothetical protein
MFLFIFSTPMPMGGEYTIGIIHNSLEEAMNYSTDTEKSLNEKLWETTDLVCKIEVINEQIGFKFL